MRGPAGRRRYGRPAGPVQFSWQVGPTEGAPVVSGFDFAAFEGGRINRLYGFFKGY
ncbi:hypothetical protein ACFCX4_00040 [Kitasatospora sp. NPDC056327]|uniref:hypothetical protein n=1 Tax=Kitasatospora sp. NPDC056327 TaxID=3345785 RepID=UPI0035DD59AA